jgi:hypothetical protein
VRQTSEELPVPQPSPEGETPLDVAMGLGAFAMIDLLRSKQAQGRSYRALVKF